MPYEDYNLEKHPDAGQDEILAELLKLVEKEQIHIITDLFNAIYSNGIIPNEWLISI